VAFDGGIHDASGIFHLGTCRRRCFLEAGQMREQAVLGFRVLVQIHGDVGGFGAGSRFNWQALGTVRYSSPRVGRFRVEYRDVNVDFEHGHHDFFYNDGYRGPIASATYSF
jgi:hypothetical protein